MTDILARDLAATEALVQSAATGDEIAFARLVAEHHASMARVAFVICGDADATRDAVQSAWTIAWRRMGSLRDPLQVRPWLVATGARFDPFRVSINWMDYRLDDLASTGDP
ncbi:MAG TPA: hypothetical protein VJZ72_02390, partial [Candidatus Limnocylindrales bacterium]|nr:hypothetical protein [Candidatus Limnocylindrales bacterium]